MKIRNLLSKRTTPVIALTAAGCHLIFGPAAAQNMENFESAQALRPSGVYGLDAGFTHRTKADIDDGGEFSVTGVQVGAGGAWQLWEPFLVDASIGYEFSKYDFSGRPFGFAVNPMGLDPWEDIHSLKFSSFGHYRLDDQWHIYGGPIFTFAGEDDSDYSHSFAGGGLAGFSYRFSEDLSAGLVVGAFSRIEEDPAMFLFPTLDWNFCEQWELLVGYTPLGSGGGLGLEVGYDLTGDLRLGLGAQYQKRRFLLADDGPVPDGVGEDQSIPIYVRALWKATERIDLGVHAGVTAGGEITIENDHGHEVAESDFDPSAQIGVRASFKF